MSTSILNMRILRSPFIGSEKRLVAIAQIGAHPHGRK